MKLLNWLRRHQPDYLVILIVTVLAAIGFVLQLNAAGQPTAQESAGFWEKLASADWTYPRLHALWFGLGCILSAVVMAIPYSFFGKVKELLYWGSVALLGAVLVVGKIAGGAQSWFTVFENRGFQPSELAKIALIVVLARELAEMPEGVRRPRQLIRILWRVGIPLVLICLQPDFGTALVYVVITAVMLFGSGTHWGYLAGLTAAGAAAMVPLWKFVISDKQKARFLVFLDPSLDATGSGYQVRMSVRAIGSGQLFGKGMFAPGAMSQMNYIPAQRTDFIFAVAAETFGLIGALVIVGLYLVLLWRLIRNALRAGDRFGQMIVLGVAAMLLFHVVENIGMCVSVMPMTGIPLPFISYGGSSMWSNLLAVAMAQNVFMRQDGYKIGRKELI